jgi:hypothetical protein
VIKRCDRAYRRWRAIKLNIIFDGGKWFYFVASCTTVGVSHTQMWGSIWSPHSIRQTRMLFRFILTAVGNTYVVAVFIRLLLFASVRVLCATVLVYTCQVNIWFIPQVGTAIPAQGFLSKSWVLYPLFFFTFKRCSCLRKHELSTVLWNMGVMWRC